MAFYDIFEQLCREKGVSPTQAGRENGIKQGTVSMWKKRGSIPSGDVLIKLSEYLNTTPTYLLGNSDTRTASQNGYQGTLNLDDETKNDPEKLQQVGGAMQSAIQSTFRTFREVVALGEALVKLENGENLTNEEWDKLEPVLNAAYIRKLLRDQEDKKS